MFKMSAESVSASLDKYGDDDLMSTLLRYGLFVGAIFQLVCIGASILLPTESSGTDGEGSEESKHGTDTLPNVRRLHKLRKQEKKKRR